MGIQWSNRFATLYMVIGAAEPIERDRLIGILRPVIGRDWTSSQYPVMHFATPNVVLETERVEDDYAIDSWVVRGGPYDGMQLASMEGYDPTRDRPPLPSPRPSFVTAMKWNIRRRDNLRATRDVIRQPFTAMRTAVRAALPDASLMNLTGAPYGEAISGDRGVPLTPPLPPEPAREGVANGDGVPWGALLAGAGMLLLAATRS
jgi:hypothetical protein